MKPLDIAIEGLSLDTVVGTSYSPDDGGGHPRTLADAIVDAAVRSLVASPEYLSTRDRVRQIRDEEIRRRVAAEVDAALTAPTRKTDQFGEPVGPPTSLRAEIARIAEEAVRVRPHGHYGDPPAVERVIREEVNRALAAELSNVVKSEKEKVVAAVRAKAAELIADAVRQGIGR